jgi:hypothetical protein
MKAQRLCGALSSVLVVSFLSSPFLSRAESSDEVFDSKVLPVLKARCLPCHDDRTRTSGFSIWNRGDVIQGGARRGQTVVPGKPDDSGLVKMLRGDIAPRMPMGSAPLPPESIKVVEDWIRGLKPEQSLTVGAKWWAFEVPKRLTPPGVQTSAWARNPIDQFILRGLEAKKLGPAPEASRNLLIRRAYFDLVGLPPTPEEQRVFLSDQTPDAYEKLVDRLLADPRFGERWGRHWLDLARYADTDGFEGDMERPHMWRYRDYVVNSFNNDKPYNQFIREQVAGDEMSNNPEGLVAAGFLRLAAWHPLGVTEEARQALLSEMTSAVSAVFLGLTVKCAQCHDHKYDPIPQKDFFRMQSFFMPIELTDAKAEFRSPEILKRMEAGRAENTRRLKEAEARFAAYEQELMPKLASVVREERGPDAEANPKMLADRLIRNDAGTLSVSFDPKFTLAEKQNYLELWSDVDPGVIRTLRDAGEARRRLERYQPMVHTVRNVALNSRGPSLPHNHLRLGGDYNRLGEIVTPGFLSAVITGHDAVDPAEETPSRTRLAEWIVDPGNPLTARVMVNRIWQHVFGEGLVTTPSDFGKNGARPSNPELLDWLATEFVSRKWSTKAMIRLMMTSSAYRQSSIHSSRAAEKADPANMLLWRMNRKRLEGEIIRDNFLFVSGLLNPVRGGPGVFPVLPGNLADITIKNKKIWEPSDGAETNERSIYLFQRRQLEVPFLSVMDAPVLNLSCERRSVSTTAVQALTLMNDDFSYKQAAHFAQRVKGDVGPDAVEQVQRAYELAFSRRPSREEAAKAIEFIRAEGAQGLEAFCRVLLNTNEFVYVN